MDIDGLGEKQVAALQARGLVTTAPDIYALTTEQLVELDRFATISAANLIGAIDASRDRPFGRVLFALGIEEVGAVTGQNLARRFRDIDALLGASPEAIEETPGIGAKMARTIADQLAEPAMLLQIERLRAAGLRFSEDGPTPGEGPLAELTFVLTGTLPTLSREQATERILAAGGRVTSAVSRKTDYLVAGESAGTKLEKAERLGVAVIDEAGLLGLIDSPRVAAEAG
jgi:DNA ligase (NAD+)